MLRESVILAGGLGTRLKSVSGETPKPLVSVSGKPFVYYILDSLLAQGITHIIFAVSYRSDFFMSEVGEQYKSAKISYSVEKEPLGTGGAIRQALEFCSAQDVLVTNGDTFLDVSLEKFYQSHKLSAKNISMALAKVEDLSRYGSVNVSENKIVGFAEKGESGEGIINGGMYLLFRPSISLPAGSFSFEEVILRQHYREINPFLCDGYFIDIGIPSDYFKACNTFKS